MVVSTFVKSWSTESVGLTGNNPQLKYSELDLILLLKANILKLFLLFDDPLLNDSNESDFQSGLLSNLFYYLLKAYFFINILSEVVRCDLLVYYSDATEMLSRGISMGPLLSSEFKQGHSQLYHYFHIRNIIMVNVLLFIIIHYNNMNIKYIVLLAILTTLLAQDPCQTLIQGWSKNYSSIPGVVTADSGKFLNDLGDYNNCNFNGDNYTYLTMSVVNTLLMNYQYVGFCLPNECNSNVLDQDFAKQIQTNLNEQYMNATGSKTPLFVRLSFSNPKESAPTWQLSNILVLVLIVFLILLSIVASVVSLTSKSQAKSIRLLKSFSLYDNLKKIITVGHAQNENLLFLNGIRVISIIWVIYGHDQWFRFINIKNWVQSDEILTTPGLVTLTPSAYFAVDTFFWVGGFLITITLVEKMASMKKITPGFFCGLLTHRFFRIWPTYMVAILFFWKIAPLTLSGPIWPAFHTITNSCNNGGVLWNMFFIDNFQDHGPSGMDYCFGWGWYLANDFQFFIITPFIFWLYVRNKKWGFILSVALFSASIITAFVLIMVNDWRYPMYNPKMKAQPEFMDKFYYKPYIRISAYIMGMWSGMFYLQWKNKTPFFVNLVEKVTGSVLIRTLFYIFGAGLVNFVIWIIVPFQQGEIWSTTSQAFYNSFNRVLFLFGVMLCTFPAMFGCKNDPCHIILGSPLFSPIAKVSFCMYLVHFIVIMMGTFSNRMDLYWQPTSALYIIAADVVWSILLATCLSVLVEAPIMGLQKILLRGEGKKDKASTPKRIEFQQDKSLSNPLLVKTSTSEQNSLKINEDL